MNDKRGHNATRGKQGFQPVVNPEPSTGLDPSPKDVIFDRRGNPLDPNACRYCDWAERTHPMVYTANAGLHTYTAPDNTLRLERMKARRTFRA